MIGPIDVAPVTVRHSGMDGLRDEAAGEGFSFMERLIADWLSHANRFDGPGECLLGAFHDARLIAVGGLNRDPYSTSPRTGRVRHLYVLNTFRGHGVGSKLLEELLGRARATFDVVRLRTDDPKAAAFYLRHGFTAVADASATHLMRF